MTWSYLSSAPGSSDRSWVRLMIGDNTTAAEQFQDEELDVLLSDQGSKERAAIAAARALGAKYTYQADKTVGRLRISASQKAGHFFKLADQLEKDLRSRAGGAYAGGISIADKALDREDPDAVASAFARGQFDTIGLESNSTDRWS